jgi:hypothetical protein
MASEKSDFSSQLSREKPTGIRTSLLYTLPSSSSSVSTKPNGLIKALLQPLLPPNHFLPPPDPFLRLNHEFQRAPVRSVVSHASEVQVLLEDVFEEVESRCEGERRVSREGRAEREKGKKRPTVDLPERFVVVGSEHVATTVVAIAVSLVLVVLVFSVLIFPLLFVLVHWFRRFSRKRVHWVGRGGVSIKSGTGRKGSRGKLTLC